MRIVVTALFLFMLTTPALAQAPDGAAVYQRECAACHANPTGDSRAPTREALRQFFPDAIVTVLTAGAMRAQGEKLSEAERRAVAEFLTDKTTAPGPTVITEGRCTTSPPMSDPTKGPSWNGWGNGVGNTRYQPVDLGGLTGAAVSKLTLKWAFGLPDVLAARGQPTVAGGRLFTSTDKGDVFALDAKTGCLYWTFRAQAGVRTAITVGPYKTSSGTSGYAAVLRRRTRQRVCSRCHDGTATLDPQDRRSPGCHDDRGAHAARRPLVRPDGRHRGGGTRRTARL